MDYTKLNKRIEHLFETERDDYFLNLNIKPDIQAKLYDYQQLHLYNLLTAYNYNNVIIDTSDTGTGKTYTSIAFCKQLNLKPIIICPKILISNWERVAKLFGVECIQIINYDAIKKPGKYFDYLTISKSKYNNNSNSNSNIIYEWDINPNYYKHRNIIIIFDEVHKCKNPHTLNGQLLLSTKNKKLNVLMISATMAETPENFYVFGYMLDFFKTRSQSKSWTTSLINEDRMSLNKNPSALSKKLYPVKGSHMLIKELGNKFPTNQISADCYMIDSNIKKKVNAAFDLINLYSNNTQIIANSNNDNSYGKILKELIRARQLIETAKINIIKNLALEYIENNCSVVIFVNYINTLNILQRELKTNCVLYGDQTNAERELNIKLFQENKSDIIICTIGTGSTGIDLHDLHGKQRVSIISPSFSSNDLLQALGRIHRAGSQTPAIQRIIYCNGTCEQIICNRLREKIKFIDTLNNTLSDRDLFSI